MSMTVYCLIENAAIRSAQLNDLRISHILNCHSSDMFAGGAICNVSVVLSKWVSCNKAFDLNTHLSWCS